jgi:hypothetical protein
VHDCPATTVVELAAGGERLPSLAVALAYSTACGGDRDVWEKRWQAAADQQRALPVEALFSYSYGQVACSPA